LSVSALPVLRQPPELGDVQLPLASNVSTELVATVANWAVGDE
jgi:hypothetical protein